MKIDIEELKRLAEAATPGPWSTYMNTMQNVCIRKMNKGGYEECEIARNAHHKNAAYIAAANPAAVLELIAERDKLLARAEKAEQELAAERKRLDWALEKAATFYEWQGKHYLSYGVPENDGFDVIESTDPRATIDELIAGDAGEKK